MSKYSNIDIERMRDEVLDYGDDVFYAYNKVVPYHTNKKEAEFADIFIDTVKSQIKNALDVGKSIENARKILHKEIRRSAINELNRVL